jgi:hypothetical protein
MASSALNSSTMPSRRPSAPLPDPVGPPGRGGIFLPSIHSLGQVSRVSCIQRPTIWYLGDRITCVADLRVHGGAERMVPIATRKRFDGGEDVQPAR